MRAFSLVLVIVQSVAVALANGYYSPISGCQIALGNYRFDICPLLSQRNYYSGHLDLVLHHQTPPTFTTILYYISLNGPLRASGPISGDEQVSFGNYVLLLFNCFVIQCISGPWACLSSKLSSTSLHIVPALTELI